MELCSFFFRFLIFCPVCQLLKWIVIPLRILLSRERCYEVQNEKISKTIQHIQHTIKFSIYEIINKTS